MNAKAIFLFSGLLLFSGFLPLCAQGPEAALLREIDAASLIVRLPSQQKKIAALQSSLEDPELSEASRERLEGLLATTTAETQEYNRTIVQVFTAYFKAMPLYFIYDTTHNPAQAVFIGKDLQSTPTPPLNGPLLQLRIGRPEVDAGNRPESLVLTDSALQELSAPFPKPLPLTSIGFGINKLLAPEIALVKMLERRVKKLDRQLGELLPATTASGLH